MLDGVISYTRVIRHLAQIIRRPYYVGRNESDLLKRFNRYMCRGSFQIDFQQNVEFQPIVETGFSFQCLTFSTVIAIHKILTWL